MSAYLGPGLLNADWGPGPVSADWRPGPVNAGWGLGLRMRIGGLRVCIHSVVYIVGYVNMFNLWFGFDLAWFGPRVFGQHCHMLLIFRSGPQKLCLGLVFIVSLCTCGYWYVNGTFFVSTGEL